MASHGYDDDFDMVDAEWNQYDSYAMRRAPQQTQIHMTQQMTTKVAPAYDGRTSFFAFEDAIDDWCDNQEFGPLLEVQMSKKCTPLWREAHLEVKMLKTPGVRTTFGGSDVASLRFTTLHYTTLHYTTLHNTTTTTAQLHSTTFHYTPLH